MLIHCRVTGVAGRAMHPAPPRRRRCVATSSGLCKPCRSQATPGFPPPSIKLALARRSNDLICNLLRLGDVQVRRIGGAAKSATGRSTRCASRRPPPSGDELASLRNARAERGVEERRKEERKETRATRQFTRAYSKATGKQLGRTNRRAKPVRLSKFQIARETKYRRGAAPNTRADEVNTSAWHASPQKSARARRNVPMESRWNGIGTALAYPFGSASLFLSNRGIVYMIYKYKIHLIEIDLVRRERFFVSRNDTVTLRVTIRIRKKIKLLT